MDNLQGNIDENSSQINVDEEKELEFLKTVVRDEMDETDIKIYQILRDNGRTTDTELAEKLDLSITTARRRRSKLEEEGYIFIMALLFFHQTNIAYADCIVSINSNLSVQKLNDFIEETVNNIRIYEVTKYVGKRALLLRFLEKDMESVNQYIHNFLMGREIVEDFDILPAIGTPKAWNRITDFPERPYD